MKRKRKPVRIPPGPRKFIKAWQQASCVAEVAIKVRSTKDACRRRACRYRRLGVPLKSMLDVPGEPLDWDELAEYARELAPDYGDAADNDGDTSTSPEREDDRAGDADAKDAGEPQGSDGIVQPSSAINPSECPP